MIYRIVEVNIEDYNYKVIYGGTKRHNTLEKAVLDYVQNDVYSKDKQRFMNFFHSHYNKIPETLDSVYYRRKVNDEWRFVCMDFIKITEPIALLVVRDVEDDVEEFFTQITRD